MKIFGRFNRRKIGIFLGTLVLCCLVFIVSHFNLKVPFLYTLVKPIALFIKQLTDVLREFEFNVSRSVKDIKIILWTKNATLYEYEFTGWNKTALVLSRFNNSNPTKMFFHGFSDNPRTIWTKSFRDQYFDVKPYNIFSVDWSLLALSPWYTTAAKNADTVGKHVANFVNFLVSEGTNIRKIHLLGASLGAHVAGHVGYYTQGKIGRITGLDPSGPLFHSIHHKHRLDTRDAIFVDIIHSAGKWVGNDDIMGHVDFFVNGGRAPQPLCINKESVDLSCSHFVSWKMYGLTISLKKNPFYAIQCENAEDFYSGFCCEQHYDEYVRFGEYVDTLNTRGTFYFQTSKHYPFTLPLNSSIGCKRIKL